MDKQPPRSSQVGQAIRTLLDTWQQGRKVLIVIGAGASVAAKVPLMSSVFADLRKRLQDANLPDVFLIKDLLRDLIALERGEAPRSLAAMALGTLQKAHERTKQVDDVQGQLAKIWDEFSETFIAGKIALGSNSSSETRLSAEDRTRAVETIGSHAFLDELLRVLKPAPASPMAADEKAVPIYRRTPTKLHYLLAHWTMAGWANIVSVNFDGLTRKALDDVIREQANGQTFPAALVLSEPKALRNFAFGGNDGDVQVNAVIKVWGDVFHAVCTNPRCPEAGVRVPIFRLPETPREPANGLTQTKPDRAGKGREAEKTEHHCPSCHQRRQLQIFFTGYEEKEIRTQELMEEMLRVVAPHIGCVLTVGFSGLWDESLVKFIATTSGLIAHENKPTNPGAASCVCVDTDEMPALLHHLELHGVVPCYIRANAEEFASIFDNLPAASGKKLPALKPFGSEDDLLNDGLWHGGKDTGVGKKVLAEALPATYEHLRTQGYLQQMARLRQLGIKTKISIAMRSAGGHRVAEADHNRRMHSRGAAHLAALWFRKLSAPLNLGAPLRERLCGITVFAALHHDLGHLPFTHLTEEIFDELHWTISDWNPPFRHYDNVLENPLQSYQTQLETAISATASELDLESAKFRHWAESAIQGRSGYPWIDAIVNSPLDVDKLDYVFRDCLFLDQQLHIPQKNAAIWVEQLFSHSWVLPSGLVALDGIAGDHARDFLEERWWLYRRQYLLPGFRAVERLARAVIIQWLLWRVASVIGSEVPKTTPRRPILDSAAVKGRIARKMLWDELTTLSDQNHGEPELLVNMAQQIASSATKGPPQSPKVKEWARQCRLVFEDLFKDQDPSERRTAHSLLDYLRKTIGVTCSESFYLQTKDLPRIREIARHLETMRPFRALIDIAVFPRMLAYPTRRRFRWGEDPVIGECFAVSNKDPDRWSVSSNRWIPLSESAFGERDRNRWAKAMVVSPFSDDPEVWHMLDRFRNECRRQDIRLLDVDPEKAIISS